MKKLYQKREPQMSSLLKLFSADRLKKGDLSTTNFFAKFKESLPTYLVTRFKNSHISGHLFWCKSLIVFEDFSKFKSTFSKERHHILNILIAKNGI